MTHSVVPFSVDPKIERAADLADLDLHSARRRVASMTTSDPSAETGCIHLDTQTPERHCPHTLASSFRGGTRSRSFEVTESYLQSVELQKTERSCIRLVTMSSVDG